MSYSRKVFEAASIQLQRRRDKAEKQQLAHRNEAYVKLPQLISIDREIASAGAEVVKAIGMGANAQKFIDDLARSNLAAQNKKKELLKSAGYPEDYLDTHYVCQKCRDTGFVEGYMCDCFKSLLKQTALAQLNDLTSSANTTFDNFSLKYYPDLVDEKSGINLRQRMGEIYNFCKCYAEDFDTDSPGILMYGETGLGKTHLSLAIANKVVEKGFDVIYGSAQNLMRKLEKEHFSNQKNNEYEGSADTILSCDLLIIDDLGAEFSTQFTIASLYNIVNTRMMANLPTIISTNLSPEQLEQKYTARITSRIIGNYVALRFFGRDIRQIKKYEQE